MRRRRALPAGWLLIAGLAMAGCGADSPRDVLSTTAENLGKVRTGRMALRVVLEPLDRSANGISVSVRGPFALARPGRLPVAQLEYVQAAGPNRAQATLISVSDRAFVRLRGRDYRLPEAQAAALRSPATGGGVTLGQLHVADWIEDPKVADAGGGLQRVTGRLDLAAALRDILAVGRRTGGSGPRLDAEQVRRLSESVRASSVEVLTGSDDRMLRRIRGSASVTLPPSLRRSAGGPGIRVSFDFGLEDVNRPVSVRAPAHAAPLPASGSGR